MSSTQQQYSGLGGKAEGKNECYTRECEIENLLLYLENVNLKDKVFWLPFDTEYSFIYIYMLKYGYKVKISNLFVGKDFFEYEEPEYDIIISNPPFTDRTKIFKRLESFNKPYIMLQPVQFFNNASMVRMLCKQEDLFSCSCFQFLFPDHRMGFITIKEDKLKDNVNALLFTSFWLCKGLNLENGKTFIQIPTIISHKTIKEYDITADKVFIIKAKNKK
jgi:hypothetical protein